MTVTLMHETRRIDDDRNFLYTTTNKIDANVSTSTICDTILCSDSRNVGRNLSHSGISTRFIVLVWPSQLDRPWSAFQRLEFRNNYSHFRRSIMELFVTSFIYGINL